VSRGASGEVVGRLVEEKVGMTAGIVTMNVIWVKLFFSFDYDGENYPCTLIEWFRKAGHDPVTGLWVVRPDIMLEFQPPCGMTHSHLS